MILIYFQSVTIQKQFIRILRTIPIFVCQKVQIIICKNTARKRVTIVSYQTFIIDE